MTVAAAADRAGQSMRAEGWLDFEVAIHRASRAAAPVRTTGLASADLPEAPSRTLNWPEQPLSRLLEQRRSTRAFTSAPLTTDQVLDVVVPSFRTRSGRPACAIPGSAPIVTATVLADGSSDPMGAPSPLAFTERQPNLPP